MPARARRKTEEPNSPHPDQVGQSPHSTITFRGRVFSAGIFRCPADSSQWDVENWIGRRANLVFPRVPVRIRQRGHPSVITDPSTAVLYLHEQWYEREALTERGDECEWFAFDPEVFFDAAVHAGLLADPDPAATPSLPFPTAPCSSRVYLMQRRLTGTIAAGVAEPIEACERAFEILSCVMRDAAAQLGAAAPARRRRQRADTAAAYREMVEAARLELNRRFRERITVEDLARAAHCSPFHLCRVYRAVTGSTIHSALTDLRLRAALEQVSDSRDDLSFIAADCGFSSAAHFSTAFRVAFDVPPSSLRAGAPARTK